MNAQGGGAGPPARNVPPGPVPLLSDAPWPALHPLVFAQSCDGMLLVDSERRIGDVNRAMEALTGLSRDDLIGRSCLDVFQGQGARGADRPAESANELDRIIADGRAVGHWRAVVTTKSGELSDVSLSYSPLAPGTRAGPCGLLVARALPPAKHVERLPADLISTVSHELRTPLTSVKGCASMLLHHRDGLDEERVRDFLRIIDEQADRLRELIDNLADLSKMEAGALRLHRRPVPLIAILDKVIEVAGSRGRQIVSALALDDLPALDVDARRVEQCLRGLVEALAPDRRPGVALTIGGESRDGEMLMTIAGRGELSLDAAAAPGAEGGPGRRRLDLQMSLCRGIVAAHGGRMWVESVPDHGPVVHLTLPIAAQRTLPATPSTSAAATLEAPRAAPLHARTPSGRSRVLVVDDDARILKFVRATLESTGYDVRLARDGRSALDHVESDQPDLILLDLVLQDMDGFEVCQRVREFSTVPIIVLTAKGSGADKVRALDLGADDYLTKPFETAELLARVRAVLRRASFSGEPEALPVFTCGQVQVDFAWRRVLVAGREVSLSPTEYKVLHQLVTNAGRVLVHEELLARVWGPEYRGEVEYLRSYVRHLRRKMEPDPAEPRYILTQSGVGYYFRAP